MHDNAFLDLLRRAFPNRVSCTMKEAMDRTGVPNSTLHRKMEDGSLPTITVSVGEKGRKNRVIDLTLADETGPEAA